MTAGLPPWRVFDAPAIDLDASARAAPEGAGQPGGPSLGVTGGPVDSSAREARPDGRPNGGSGADAASRASTGSAVVAAAAGLVRRPDVLAGLAVALGGLVLAWLLATGGPGGSVSLAGATVLMDDPGSSAGAGGAGEIVVDVVGAVRRPGVYHLPRGSRIGDAIAAAGGYGPRVAAEQVDRALNLAAPLHDGDQVVVPSRDDGATSTQRPVASSAAGGRLIDLNTATASELDTLPGIGPVTAAKIVASRDEQPFRTVQDLIDRKLVSQKTFDSIKGLVRVG